MSNVSNLVKKTVYNMKINEIEKKITDHDYDKYITTPESNKLTAENFAARLTQANLPSKNGITNFVKKTDFDDKLKNLNKKITSNKRKHVLVENEFKKLQTFDSSLFIGQSYFNNDGAQFYLIFQLIYKTITTFSDLKHIILEWESKGLSNGKFTCAYIANVSVCSKLIWMNSTKIRLKFKESCLKEEDKAAYTQKNANLFIVYELDT